MQKSFELVCFGIKSGNRFYAVFGEELDKARANKQVNEGSEVIPLDAVRSQKLKAIASILPELAEIINQML